MKPLARVAGLASASMLLPLLMGCAPMPRSTAHQPDRYNWAAVYDGKNPGTKEILHRANDPLEQSRPEWDREEREEWARQQFDPLDFYHAEKQVVENLGEEPYLYSDPGIKGSEM